MSQTGGKATSTLPRWPLTIGFSTVIGSLVVGLYACVLIVNLVVFRVFYEFFRFFKVFFGYFMVNFGYVGAFLAILWLILVIFGVIIFWLVTAAIH
jgi:hypothetical protein